MAAASLLKYSMPSPSTEYIESGTGHGSVVGLAELGWGHAHGLSVQFGGQLPEIRRGVPMAMGRLSQITRPYKNLNECPTSNHQRLLEDIGIVVGLILSVQKPTEVRV